MEISNIGKSNMNLDNNTNNENKQKIPYYLLSLDEQGDEFVLSNEGKAFVENCKEIMRKNLDQDEQE